MADLDFKTPEEIAQEYLDELKVLKPQVNTSQQDSDWWIRSRVIGGVVSGAYADQRLIANDAFPQRARRDAVGRHLETWLNDTFKDAQQSEGFARVSGAASSVVPVATSFLYEPNGNTYSSTEEVNFGSRTAALVPIKSVSYGQAQNLLSEAPLTLPSPPSGVASTGAASGNISNGRDIETTSEAAARVLDRIRNPQAGGTESDYRQWAVESDDAVVSASVIRHYAGLGTVGVVITAGTTDIDTAIDNGQDVVLTPSDALVNTVQDYIDTKKPLTDCALVFGPTLISIDVTARVRFLTGTKDTILSGQTLTQGQLVQREIKRSLYKMPAGGRRFGATGFVVASEIEEVVDIGLSAAPYTEGVLPILLDRQIGDLSATGVNRKVLPNEQPIPGAITILEF